MANSNFVREFEVGKISDTPQKKMILFRFVKHPICFK